MSRAQLEELGYSNSSVTRACAAGRLHRIHRGVYAVGHSQISRHGELLAAVLASGQRAVLSHASAAWLLGLAPRWTSPIHVTVPARGGGRKGIHLHHAPALAEGDTAIKEGIPVTRASRTMLDLAATLPAHGLGRMIERAEKLELFDLKVVDALLTRTSRHPGASRLRRALALYEEPAFTRSELERRFLELVAKAKLPVPRINVYVEGYELDMYWPKERFAVELDGYEYHSSRAAFERDRVRQEALKLLDIEMIRITAHRIADEPQVVVENVAALLERRRGARAKST